jgi:large subunit ribosomal protein LP0
MSDVETKVKEFGGTARKDRKLRYKQRLLTALRAYKHALIVGVDNVGSRQMQVTRMLLRGEAEIVMGKNTIMRKVIRDEAEATGNEALLDLAATLQGNVGLILCNGDLKGIAEKVLGNQVPAAARAGAVSPVEVIIPAGSTGLDPGQTAFFQVLNIGTKIARGSIEIVSPVTLLTPGDKVTASHVALLAKMNIKPFFYGFKVQSVFEDGFVYGGEILSLSEEDLCNKFVAGAHYVAAVGLELGIPSVATVGHSIAKAFHRMVAITDQVDWTFAEAKEFQSASASAAPAASGAAAAAAPEPEPESSSSSSEAGSGFF